MFVARDEHEVRRTLQHAYHRPKSEKWAASILRIRAVHRRRITRWLEDGTVDQVTADRMRRCTPPGANTPKDRRRYCEHPVYPYCHYHRLLQTYRQLWHHLCEPELQRRRAKGAAVRRGRTRLALGQVVVDVAPDEDVRVRVRELLNERVIRKIQRAGGIRDGIATVSIHHGNHGYSIRICVLGLTDRSVQRDHPQGPRSRGWADVSTDWAIEWQAAVRGHDAPKFGPASLLRLLCKALPVGIDDTGLCVKRLQPLGRCREFICSRPDVFPRPICYLSNRRKRQSPWAEQCDEEKIDRLHRFVARRMLQRLSEVCGLTSSRVNTIIGRFFRMSQEIHNEVQGETVCVDWLCKQLRMPVVLIPRFYFPNRIGGFMPAPAKGGKAWESITACCLEEFHNSDVCLVMRPPGKIRGAVVVHRLDAAVPFGRADYVRGTDVYVQHIDRFLDYVMEVWTDRPRRYREILALASN